MTIVPAAFPPNALPRRRLMVGHHYPELDGIRGLAILLVLLFHCGAFVDRGTFVQKLYRTLADCGWVGVELFFVLSGFLITGILLDTRHQKHYFLDFYARRALRIFPLYYAFLAGILLLGQFPNDSIAERVSYWLYLQNWLPFFRPEPESMVSHLWSLAVEEQFYLTWPALVLFAARRNAVGTLCLATAVFGFTCRSVLVMWDQPAYFLTIARVEALAFGAYVAVLFRRHGSLVPLRQTARRVALASGVMLLFVAGARRGFFGFDDVVLIVGYTPLALFFSSGVVLALSAGEDSPLRRCLRTSGLRKTGTISYGIYIFHAPIVLLLGRRWPWPADGFWLSYLGFVATAVTASWAVAWVSFRFFESPILGLKQRLAVLRRDAGPEQATVPSTQPARLNA